MARNFSKKLQKKYSTGFRKNINRLSSRKGKKHAYLSYSKQPHARRHLYPLASNREVNAGVPNKKTTNGPARSSTELC